MPPTVYSCQSLLGLSRLIEDDTRPLKVSAAKREVTERIHVALKFLLPDGVDNTALILARSFEVFFVGEVAIWVASGNRMWKPRSLQIMVKSKDFERFVDMLKEQLEGWEQDWLAPEWYPRSPMCYEFIAKKNAFRVQVYRAATDDVEDTINSAWFSPYNTFFCKTSDETHLFTAHGVLGDWQVAFIEEEGNVLTSEDDRFWKKAGWRVDGDKKARQAIKIDFDHTGNDNDEAFYAAH